MWDFADNQELAAIAAAIYEAGGIVGAVCHEAALVNLKLSDGQYLVANTALPGVMRYNKNKLKKYTNESIFS